MSADPCAGLMVALHLSTEATMTSQTIVAGYDGSPASLAAVEHAVDLAAPDGHLVLVHAYQVPADFIGASYYNAMHDDAKEHAIEVLDALERDCERLATVEHERDLILALPATAITGSAEAHHADQI